MLHGTSMVEVLTARAFTSDGVEGVGVAPNATDGASTSVPAMTKHRRQRHVLVYG